MVLVLVGVLILFSGQTSRRTYKVDFPWDVKLTRNFLKVAQIHNPNQLALKMKELPEGPLWARLLGIMKTLADPVRLSIVLSARNAPKTYRELMALTRKSKSQISKHVSLLKKLELVQTTRKDQQVHIRTTRLARTLLQTLRGVILQAFNRHADGDNKPFAAGAKGGVPIPISTLHGLLKDRAHLLDLLLLTAQTTEQTYWQEIAELLQLAKQYGLELDIVRLPVLPPKKP